MTSSARTTALITSTQPAPRVWPIFVLLPLMTLWQYITAVMLGVMLYVVDRQQPKSHLMQGGLVWISFIVLMWFSVAMGAGILSRRPLAALGVSSRPHPGFLAASVIAGSSLQLCATGLSYLLHVIYVGADFSNSILNAPTGQLIAWLFVACGLGSVAEELFLRGFVLRRMVARWNVGVALLVFAAVGAAENLGASGFSKFANAAAAVVAGIITFRRGSTFYAIAFSIGYSVTHVLAMREIIPSGADMPVLAIPALLASVALLVALPAPVADAVVKATAASPASSAQSSTTTQRS